MLLDKLVDILFIFNIFLLFIFKAKMCKYFMAKLVHTGKLNLYYNNSAPLLHAIIFRSSRPEVFCK